MTVLVTGGAGYIGSHTVRLLRSRKYDVVVLDSMELGHAESIGDTPLVVGDISDPHLVAETIRSHRVDALIHFAAYKAAGESMVRPGRYFANNVAASLGLLDAVSAAGVRRVVFSSSCAVYGTPETLPVDETQPVRPESPYGESKALVERMLHWYGVCHGLDWVSLRYYNAAGAAVDGSAGEDWSVTVNLIPLAMKALLGRIPELQIFGTDYPTADGTAMRDYIHVDDLAHAHLCALEYLAVGGTSDVFNLGTGNGSTVRQVLAAVEKAAGRPVPAIDAPRRAGDPVALYADNTKARKILGWVPRHDLEDIVTSAWTWHSAHPDGYGGSPA
jgi:UDP-glucose-4-epimerase GalE